jgi:hypothetical protein
VPQIVDHLFHHSFTLVNGMWKKATNRWRLTVPDHYQLTISGFQDGTNGPKRNVSEYLAADEDHFLREACANKFCNVGVGNSVLEHLLTRDTEQEEAVNDFKR